MKTPYKLDFKEDPVIFEYILMINAGINTTKQLFLARNHSLYKEIYKSKKDYKSVQPAIWKYLNRKLFKNNLIKHDKIKLWHNKKRYVINWKQINQIMINLLKERNLNEIEIMKEHYSGTAKQYGDEPKEIMVTTKNSSESISFVASMKETMNKMNNILEGGYKEAFNSMFNNVTNVKNPDCIFVNKLNISLLSHFLKHIYNSKSYFNMSLMSCLELYLSELKPIDEIKIKKEYDKNTIEQFNNFVELTYFRIVPVIFDISVQNLCEEITSKNKKKN